MTMVPVTAPLPFCSGMFALDAALSQGQIAREERAGRTTSIAASVLKTKGFAAGLQAQPASAPSTRHDGTWGVALVCTDVTDAKGHLIKGYDHAFKVQISQGRLEGRHDEPRPPAFVRFVGQVADDGTLLIKADGLTGSSDYSMGRVRPGQPYGYTLKGMLGPSSGKAERVELRPCTATFSRLP